MATSPDPFAVQTSERFAPWALSATRYPHFFIFNRKLSIIIILIRDRLDEGTGFLQQPLKPIRSICTLAARLQDLNCSLETKDKLHLRKFSMDTRTVRDAFCKFKKIVGIVAAVKEAEHASFKCNKFVNYVF